MKSFDSHLETVSHAFLYHPFFDIDSFSFIITKMGGTTLLVDFSYRLPPYNKKLPQSIEQEYQSQLFSKEFPKKTALSYSKTPSGNNYKFKKDNLTNHQIMAAQQFWQIQQNVEVATYFRNSFP